ncbi:hypothetical protein FXN61_33850 [Lentzea sp. PSKA42]|uniref:HEAT repeat-containing protein n=1 Tax=Lentzea indica TaxID=2604800 RepID=A0ABX1FR25_9PSEU|nr:hypothetical protein [Lentzea indica]NKE61479.1 hypothetical protein [Lentzea indica]
MIPIEHARLRASLTPAEIGRGGADGWVDVADIPTLAWLAWNDLGCPPGVLGELAEATDPEHVLALCRILASTSRADTAAVWRYLAADWERTGERSDGRQRFLLDRAMRGEGMDWRNYSALMGTDRPEEVDAAFDRGEDMVGVSLIGLAMSYPDPWVTLRRVARALDHNRIEVRQHGATALAHVVRIHGVVSRECLEVLRRHPNEAAEDDLWTFIAHRRLPAWLWWRRIKSRPGRRVPRGRRSRLRGCAVPRPAAVPRRDARGPGRDRLRPSRCGRVPGRCDSASRPGRTSRRVSAATPCRIRRGRWRGRR